MEKMDAERQRQQANLRQKLLERKKRKQDAQKRKQEREMAKELLEQQKELTEVRSEHVSNMALVKYCKIKKWRFIRSVIKWNDSFVEESFCWNNTFLTTRGTP